MFTKFRMKEEKGFTLIELLIVVAIIGILAAIAIPQFGAYRKRGYNAAAQSDLRSIRTSEEALMADFTEYGVVAAGQTASITLTGGMTTSTPITVSLSPKVFAGAKGNAAALSGTAIAYYNAVTGHTSGDNFYAADSDVTTLYRATFGTLPTTAALVWGEVSAWTPATGNQVTGNAADGGAAWVQTQ